MNWRLITIEIAALVLAFTLSGCATTPGGKVADGAVHADHGTTLVALTALDGVSEANPLAPLGPARYGLHYWAEGQRCEDRGALKVSTVVGGAAGGNNLFLIVAKIIGTGASWHPVGLLAGIPAYYLAKSNECEPVLHPYHQATLATWERAYEAGDAAALDGLMDNPELLARYAALFEETEHRSVVYTDTESVRGGFITHYDLELHYPDRTETRSGEVRFKLDDEIIEDVTQTIKSSAEKG